MTEEEAKVWIAARWPGNTTARLERLVALVVAENERQNLVASTTIDTIWARHVVDSLQLTSLAPPGRWIDVGTGAGFPGLAVAAAQPDRPVVLIEPRRRRAEFLATCAGELDLKNVDVICSKVETVRPPIGAVVSARAVTTIDHLFESAHHCADLSTTWLLPKGRNAQQDLSAAQQRWQGMFHVEQSITDPASSIVVASAVRRRA